MISRDEYLNVLKRFKDKELIKVIKIILNFKLSWNLNIKFFD